MRRQLLKAITKRSALIIRLFGTLLAAVLLVYLLNQQGWSDIRAALSRIEVWRFFFALCLIGISRFAVAARWYVLLKSSRSEITWWQSTRLTFAGLFATNFLPTTVGGDVIRFAGALQMNFDAVVCAASLLVDRLIGMAGMAMAVPFGLPRFIDYGVFIRSPQSFELPFVLGMALSRKWWRQWTMSIASKGSNAWRPQPVGKTTASVADLLRLFLGSYAVCVRYTIPTVQRNGGGDATLAGWRSL